MTWHPLDPCGHLPQRKHVYLWLAVFFARLAAWYWIDDHKRS